MKIPGPEGQVVMNAEALDEILAEGYEEPLATRLAKTAAAKHPQARKPAGAEMTAVVAAGTPPVPPRDRGKKAPRRSRHRR